jgi:hypothetical protein
LQDYNIPTPNIVLRQQGSLGPLAHFQLVGNIPVLRNKFKSLQRGHFKIWVASFNNLGLTASGPEALDMSKIFSISSTSFSVITICLRNIFGVRILVSKMIILQNYGQQLLRNHVVVSNIGI